jgi:hypothetical protein
MSTINLHQTTSLAPRTALPKTVFFDYENEISDRSIETISRS